MHVRLDVRIPERCQVRCGVGTERVPGMHEVRDCERQQNESSSRAELREYGEPQPEHSDERCQIPDGFRTEQYCDSAEQPCAHHAADGWPRVAVGQRDQRGYSGEESNRGNVFPELQRIKEDRVDDHHEESEPGRRKRWHERSPGRVHERNEQHKADGRQEIGAAQPGHDDQGGGEDGKQRRLKGVRMSAVDLEHRVDPRPWLAAHSWQIDFERTGGVCHRLERRNQFETGIAREKTIRWKISREQDEGHRRDAHPRDNHRVFSLWSMHSSSA